jgi:hypothetical protein
MYEKACVHYCEIKKIVEYGEGGGGSNKWKREACKTCKNYYARMGR